MHIRFSVVSYLLNAAVAAATTSCDPCIDRTEVNIAVVHHGVPAEGEMMIGIF
jgi:hypothetical protein